MCLHIATADDERGLGALAAKFLSQVLGWLVNDLAFLLVPFEVRNLKSPHRVERQHECPVSMAPAVLLAHILP